MSSVADEVVGTGTRHLLFIHLEDGSQAMSSTGGDGNVPHCEGMESTALAVMLGSALLSVGLLSTAVDRNVAAAEF
jgi:hypothetical protein